MNEDKRIIEIDGVKLEVDLRTARRIDSFKVGDNVKVLKETYGCWEALPGAIVGFTEFPTHPALEILVMTNDGDVKFITYAAPKDGQKQTIEIAPFNSFEMLIDRASIMAKLNRAVEQKESELRDATAKRDAFIKTFDKVFANEMA